MLTVFFCGYTMCKNYRQIVATDKVSLAPTNRYKWKCVRIPIAFISLKTVKEELKERFILKTRSEVLHTRIVQEELFLMKFYIFRRLRWVITSAHMKLTYPSWSM